MGDTFLYLRETQHAVEGVIQDGRADGLCGSIAGGGEDGGVVRCPESRPLAVKFRRELPLLFFWKTDIARHQRQIDSWAMPSVAGKGSDQCAFHHLPILPTAPFAAALASRTSATGECFSDTSRLLKYT
jgi:hypothetical protein